MLSRVVIFLFAQHNTRSLIDSLPLTFGTTTNISILKPSICNHNNQHRSQNSASLGTPTMSDLLSEMDEMGEIEKPIFRDIRRYYCEYCGICRSKKSLITSHMLTHHKEEMEKNQVSGEDEKEGKKSNTCQECGATFTKPAYLKQHMQSHSVEGLLII